MDARIGLQRKLSEELMLLVLCWKRLLRVPWIARRSNQSILKEISHECSLAGLMLKLKLQYFDHLMRRADSFEKTLMLGKMKAGGEGDDRGWDGGMASLTRWTGVWENSKSWWWTGRPGVLWFMGSQKVRLDWATELSWTELKVHWVICSLHWVICYHSHIIGIISEFSFVILIEFSNFLFYFLFCADWSTYFSCVSTLFFVKWIVSHSNIFFSLSIMYQSIGFKWCYEQFN